MVSKKRNSSADLNGAKKIKTSKEKSTAVSAEIDAFQPSDSILELVSIKEEPVDISSPTSSQDRESPVDSSPKPQPKKSGAGKAKRSSVCEFCLRKCPSTLVVQFAGANGTNLTDGLEKVVQALGIQLEPKPFDVCRTCWQLVEIVATFKDGCLKAKDWRMSNGGACREEDPVPEPNTVCNLTEPLLEIFKEEEESPLDIPTDTHQPYNEIMLKPKPEPTAPTPEASLFCSLCLRPCTSGQVVDFSADVASGWDKLALIAGLELELERCEICRPCWTVVETLADFREGCLKAATWRARFSFGLDGAGDDWLSKENVEVMKRTRKVVREHVERIEMAEIEARNRLGFGTDELMEENQNYPDSPEDPPKNETHKETQDIGDKLEIKTFSCAKCQRIFETKTGMKIHFDLCKKSSKDKSIEPQLHKCSICSANFTKSYLLREHRNKHLGIKPYECRKENCNQRFHGNQERFNHQKRCQGNNSSDPNTDQEISEPSAVPIATEENPPEIYPCKKCPRKFDTKGGLVNHSKRCKGPNESRKIHRCSICSIEFLHFHHLDAHMNRHNDTKPYQCKKNCEKRFYGKFELYRHTEICGKEKPICPLCGLQVSSKGGLTSHLETHAEVPTAECETCGKKFKSKKTLKKHQQSVHTNERNYPCDVCGKTLKSANSLNVHRRMHTHEKPFSCAVCGQRFAFKCLVNPHMKKNHAEDKI